MSTLQRDAQIEQIRITMQNVDAMSWLLNQDAITRRDLLQKANQEHDKTGESVYHIHLRLIRKEMR